MSNIVRRRPLTVFFTVAIGLTWAVQFAFLVQGWELTPALLVELAVLLGAAMAITGITSGRPGVRRLFAGLVRWRIGVVRFIVVLVALPLLTAGVGAVTGTLHSPEAGWGVEIANYLFLAVVFGALLGNAWEETAWAGFAQTRLMRRHGLVGGSLLTAVPFFLIHLPLAFAEKGLGTTPWDEVALTWGLLAAAAPFLRYLAGDLLVGTGGSVLSVALLHGSFNASGSLTIVDGWQYLPAMAVLALLVGLARLARRGPQPSRPTTVQIGQTQQ